MLRSGFLCGHTETLEWAHTHTHTITCSCPQMTKERLFAWREFPGKQVDAYNDLLAIRYTAECYFKKLFLCNMLQYMWYINRNRRVMHKPYILEHFGERTKLSKLDVDPQKDDDASPMSTYRCMLRPTWMISALQHKSKYKSNSI